MKQQSYYSPTDDISFIPLTKEEELSLFERYYNNNDLEARDTIIRCHLKLVAKLALRQSRGALPDDEAISAANFGLLQALEVKKFEPGRVRFGSYVRLYVRGQVLIAIRDRVRPHATFQTRNNFCVDAGLTGQVAQEVRELLGIHADAKENLVFNPHKRDEVIDGEKLVEDADRASLIQDAIAQLTDVEAAAITGTYFEQRSFADIGRRFKGVTREGIRKAHDRALVKLRVSLAFLEKEFGPILTPEAISKLPTLDVPVEDKVIVLQQGQQEAAA